MMLYDSGRADNALNKVRKVYDRVVSSEPSVRVFESLDVPCPSDDQRMGYLGVPYLKWDRVWLLLPGGLVPWRKPEEVDLTHVHGLPDALESELRDLTLTQRRWVAWSQEQERKTVSMAFPNAIGETLVTLSDSRGWESRDVCDAVRVDVALSPLCASYSYYANLDVSLIQDGWNAADARKVTRMSLSRKDMTISSAREILEMPEVVRLNKEPPFQLSRHSALYGDGAFAKWLGWPVNELVSSGLDFCNRVGGDDILRALSKLTRERTALKIMRKWVDTFFPRCVRGAEAAHSNKALALVLTREGARVLTLEYELFNGLKYRMSASPVTSRCRVDKTLLDKLWPSDKWDADIIRSLKGNILLDVFKETL